MVYRTILSKHSVILGIIILLAWVVSFYTAIESATKIWLGNDIFNHCLLVIPGAFYLIYLQREALFQCHFKANYIGLLSLIPLYILYILGLAGDIKLFTHIAAFLFIPMSIFSLIGWQASKTILFPLCFFVFAIPVGQELIPTLQDIAATGSVFLLQLTGIPVFTNGLYIEIPNGHFLVAEACSGISFFIVSIVFGSLYAHLNFHSNRKKLLFFIIALITPIVANSIRVYGIILIAHLSDMTYAVGADHLIYGWFFYCLVLMLLIYIGHLMRDKILDVIDTKISEESASYTTQVAAKSGTKAGIKSRAKTTADTSTRQVIKSAYFILALQIIFTIWVFVIQNQALTQSMNPIELNVQSKALSQFELKPERPNADINLYFTISDSLSMLNTKTENTSTAKKIENSLDILISQYASNSKGELVSSMNRIYNPASWTLRHKLTTQIKVNSMEQTLTVYEVTNPEEKNRLILNLYLTSHYIGQSKVKTKLSQTASKMLGKDNGGIHIIISAAFTNKIERDIAMADMSQEMTQLVKHLTSKLVAEHE